MLDMARKMELELDITMTTDGTILMENGVNGTLGAIVMQVVRR